MIRIKNISKSFDGFDVLNNINLEIEKGNTHSILGKSGTGKSVLLKLIVGLMQPDSGEIFIGEKEVTGIKIKELNKIRKKIGFLFQNAALYDSLSVRENLLFALKHGRKKELRDSNSKVEKYLDSVGLLSAIDKMPSELSGGMRKRVGLARALITEPEIMLYDEPTTGLDPITTREISYLMLDLQSKFNLTSIVVTHDLECAKIVSNKVSLLSDRSIKFNGTFNQFLDSEDPVVKEFIGNK